MNQKPVEESMSDIYSMKSGSKPRDLSYFNHLHLKLDKLRVPKSRLSVQYNQIPQGLTSQRGKSTMISPGRIFEN